MREKKSRHKFKEEINRLLEKRPFLFYIIVVIPTYKILMNLINIIQNGILKHPLTLLIT